MAEELARINRPAAGDVMTRRKAYQVTLTGPMPDAPPEYRALQDKYWRAVDEQVANLETRAGRVARIFIEGVGVGGEEGLLSIRQTSPQAHALAKSRIDAGAALEPYEDQDLYEQLIDWGRILQGGFVGNTVANLAREYFNSAREKRLEHLKTRLDSAIEETEAALIMDFTGVGQILPTGVERFIVSPPELDELGRLARSIAEAAMRRAEEAQRSAEQPGEQPKSDAQDRPGGAGLWVPGQS